MEIRALNAKSKEMMHWIKQPFSDIYNQLYKQKKSGEAKTIAISINISKNLIQKWKDYCEDTMVFSTSQLTTVALNKYMEMKVEKEQ